MGLPRLKNRHTDKLDCSATTSQFFIYIYSVWLFFVGSFGFLLIWSYGPNSVIGPLDLVYRPSFCKTHRFRAFFSFENSKHQNWFKFLIQNWFKFLIQNWFKFFIQNWAKITLMLLVKLLAYFLWKTYAIVCIVGSRGASQLGGIF